MRDPNKATVSKSKRPLKRIKSSAWARSFGIAKLSVNAGLQFAGHRLGQLFADADARAEGRLDLLKSQAKLLADELHQLKGSMMKAGQMLSLYGEHFLPREVVDVLKTLQSDSQPVEWDALQKILQRELGPEKLITLEIDTTPYASASMGQVHRAFCRKTGTDLCLKIQYPGVAKAIDSDLKAMRSMLLVTRLLSDSNGFDEVFKEVRQMLHREADYRHEAEATLEFRRLLQNDTRYAVPDVRLDLSTQRVLTTTFQAGISINRETVGMLNQERRNQIAQAALDLFFREFFEWGIVQTDPHFGNYLLQVDPSGRQDKLVLLDFGAVRKFSQTFLRQYHDYVWAAYAQDREAIRRAGTRLGFLREDDSAEQVRAFIDLTLMVMEPFMLPNTDHPDAWNAAGAYRWNASDLPSRVSGRGLQTAMALRFRAPPREVVFLHRKLAGVFTFLAVLQAEIAGRDVVEVYRKKALNKS